MIRKLRQKFILILMSVAAFILLAVFAAVLLSTWGNSRKMSETMLRLALETPRQSRPWPPDGDAGRSVPPGSFAQGGRMPVLLAEIKANGDIEFVTNQFHFISDNDAMEAVREAIATGADGGVLRDLSLRWQKSPDGERIAFADISQEQETLKNLITSSLLIGSVSLAAFFLLSLVLSRWAVLPVALAWERQRRFVADASHELKTPLTVILSNADMLGGEFAADEKQAKRIEHIRAESARMKRLVEDLLLLAGSDSAKTGVVKESVDISYLVKSAVLTYEPIIYDAHKNLAYSVRDGLSITGDAQRLGQLAAILLDNAVKYCPIGGRIDVKLSQTDKGAVSLCVANDGEPIPKNELEQVFERFYRVDTSRSANAGYGLGLSIARGIVDEHGGKIWAESCDTAGNRFTVTLPRG